MPRRERLKGLAYALAAILLWGLSPLYWRRLKHVPSLEVIMHRIVWSALLLSVWLGAGGRWRELRRTLSQGRTAAILAATTVLVSFNWFLYIWMINNSRVLEASLGYFILPLVIVALGMLFLGERLRFWQSAAVILAAAGVLNLIAAHGKAPWLALALAFTFGAYALLRKLAPIDALLGLSAETLILAPGAAAYLLYLGFSGRGAFLGREASTDLLLAGSALLTALPLLWYTEGTRRLSLKTIGVIQYLSPTCQFLLGIFVFREPLGRAQLLTFGLIWAALILYSADTALSYRRAPGKTPG